MYGISKEIIICVGQGVSFFYLTHCSNLSFLLNRKQQPYSDDSLLEGVRGSMSSTSSFTQVSAMNDDFLSPRSSSGSTITQTPTTPKVEPQSEEQQVTPSSVPLPPVTSSEETELATPNSTSRDLRVGDATPTPEGTQEVDDFFQQKPPVKSDLQVRLLSALVYNEAVKTSISKINLKLSLECVGIS